LGRKLVGKVLQAIRKLVQQKDRQFAQIVPDPVVLEKNLENRTRNGKTDFMAMVE